MEDSGMTLKQLLAFLWMTLKKSIIFIVVGIFIVSAILFTVKQTSAGSYYETELVFKTAERDTLSDINANKAIVVNKALETTNKPLTLSESIINNLSISAVNPGNVESLEDFIPTSYKLTLKPIGGANLLPSEYKEILDVIAVNYINYYALSDLEEISLGFDVSESFGTVEYIRITSELNDRVNDIYNTINASISNHNVSKSYSTSNGVSFSHVLEKLNSEKSNLNLIQYVIASNKVELKPNGFKSYIEWSLTNLDARIARYSSLLKTAQKNLEDYNAVLKLQSQSTTDTVLIIDSSIFNMLNNQIISYSTSLTTAEEERSLKSEQLAIYNSATADPTMVNYVKTELLESQGKINACLENYKDLVKSYNKNKYLVSEAKVSKPAYTIGYSKVSSSTMLLCAFAAAVLIYTVVAIKVYPKFKQPQEPVKE